MYCFLSLRSDCLSVGVCISSVGVTIYCNQFDVFVGHILLLRRCGDVDSVVLLFFLLSCWSCRYCYFCVFRWEKTEVVRFFSVVCDYSWFWIKPIWLERVWQFCHLYAIPTDEMKIKRIKLNCVNCKETESYARAHTHTQRRYINIYVYIFM